MMIKYEIKYECGRENNVLCNLLVKRSILCFKGNSKCVYCMCAKSGLKKKSIFKESYEGKLLESSSC